MSTSYYDKAMRTLEFDKITAMLAECCPTEGSRAMALRLTPDGDPYMIRKRLMQTSDAKRLIMSKGFPSFGSVKDVTDAIERAEKGASMNTKELLDTASLLN
ncbi:MAG: endonuclease MutS2, partial [Clostridia bacterium]|nr:endonuclease MutS2 [Clostridia bacterium]